MISIHCPNCSTEVSGSQPNCPSCNFPISKLRGLSSAILTQNAERVASLIQLGADLNAIDKNGRTPLMIAASIDSFEIVQMLLAVGARADFVNDSGETALSLAKSKEVEKILRRALVVSKFNSLQKSELKTVAPPIQTEPIPIEQRPVEALPQLTPPEQPEPIFENNQAEETHYESAQQDQPLYEESALDFNQSLIFTEVVAWENRTDSSFESAAIQETTPIETQITEEPAIKEESPLEFDDSLWITEISAWENRNALEFLRSEQQSQDKVIAHDAKEVTEEELFDFPILHEPFAEFPITSLIAVDHENHNVPDDIFDMPQIPEAVPTNSQLKEENYEHTPHEAYTHEAAQLDNPERIPDVNCLKCGQVISPKELRCSKCHSTIVRGHCSGCSELIPKHSIFCPYCGTYVMEHFYFAKKSRDKYFLAVMFASCLLILFMVVTWPRNLNTSVPKPTPTQKHVGQIVKTETPKISGIIFNPPETKNESKPEEMKNTIVASSSKQKYKRVTEKASVNRSLSSQEKIRLGRALNSQGFSLIKQGKLGEAIPVLEQSLRSFPKGTKDPYYAYALFNLGIAWRKAGRPDIAIPILEKRMTIDNQRDVVARELNTARKEAKEAGFGDSQE